MIKDQDFLEILHNHYPGHSFLMAEIEHGRTLYIDGEPIKISWLHNSEEVEDSISQETRIAIDQTVIDAIMYEVNVVIRRKMEEEASKEIPVLDKCLCGATPKLHIEDASIPSVAVVCTCGIKGKVFEVKEAIKAAEWWNNFMDMARHTTNA